MRRNPTNDFAMIEAYSGFDTRGGVFSFISGMEWEKSKLVEPKLLDRLYFAKHGERIPANVIMHRLKCGFLDSSSREEISALVELQFRLKWNKLWETMFYEYEPLHNYDLTETETSIYNEDGTLKRSLESEINEKIKNSVDLSNKIVYNDTGSNSENEKTAGASATSENSSTNTSRDSFGWNSEESSPLSRESTNSNMSNEGTTDSTRERTAATTNDGTRDTTENSSLDQTSDETDLTKQNDTSHETREQSRNLRRFGNIGITSSQNLIQQERRIWLWNYYDQIFNDVNSLLTLPIY